VVWPGLARVQGRDAARTQAPAQRLRTVRLGLARTACRMNLAATINVVLYDRLDTEFE
jgi:hypothetical protein